LNTGVTLTVRLSGEEEGRSLAAVLAPDNEGLPKGTRLSMTARGKALEFEVSSGSPSASLSIVLALLRDITLFEEVWLLSSEGEAGPAGTDLG